MEFKKRVKENLGKGNPNEMDLTRTSPVVTRGATVKVTN